MYAVSCRISMKQPSLFCFPKEAVADLDGVQGVRSNSLPAPIFKHPLSVRPNYFIFMGYIRKMG